MPPLPPPENRVLLVVNALKQEITNGVFVDVLPGERELAERLQVNRKTLRKAIAFLEGEQWFAKAERGKRRRILFKAEEQTTSYQTSTLVGKNVVVMSARPLVQLSSTEKYFQSMLTRLAEKAGVNILHRHLDVKHLDNPDHRLREFVAKNPADSYLLQNSSVEMQRWFESQSQLKCMVLGEVFEGVKLASVSGDHHATAVHLAGVMQRHGLERVIMLYPWPARRGLESFVQSFKSAAPSIGMRLLKHEESPEALANVSKLALSDDSLRSSLVLTYDVFSSVSVVTTAGCLGLRIAQDVSLVSLNGDELFEYIQPKIASYAFPWEEYTRHVVKAISEQLLYSLANAGCEKHVMPDFLKGPSLVGLKSSKR